MDSLSNNDTESNSEQQQKNQGKVNKELTETHLISTNNDNDTRKKRKLTIVPKNTKSKLHYVPLKTGVCYDVRMRYHAKIYTSYFEYIDPHPEDPRRIYRIYKILCENGLIVDPSLSIDENTDDVGEWMLRIPIREATDDEILEVHTLEHLNFIKSLPKMEREDLLKKTATGDSVYFNNDSYLSAKLSCGGAIEACKAVIEGKVKNSLAIVRPPGHHAEPQQAGGFCLFSNVAVAAKAILKAYPESVRKILILDWDIHHGNGTQKAFYEDNRVLYISLHRFELGKYYPGTKWGGHDQCGEKDGEGFNCNIPWPCGGIGDAEYIYAFQRIIMPMAQEFQPDFVIISSGFDAADGDTIGQCNVTPSCYGQMTHMLKSLANGKLCVILEGGYNLDAIARSALDVATVLIGEPPNEISNKNSVVPKPEIIKTVAEVIQQQSKYWKCFRSPYGNECLDKTQPINEKLLSKNFPLQNSIRDHQYELLADEYNFFSLPLLNLNTTNFILSPHTVLATTFKPVEEVSIFDSTDLIIHIHDTPDMWGQADPLTGVLNASTTIIIDNSIQLIKWCKEKNYHYIDINIPHSLFETDNYSTIMASQEVMIYLWNNYLQHFPNLQKIAFVGIGDSCSGLVHLLGHIDTRETVKCCISFIDKTSLKGIVPLIDESLVEWYYKNSLVFASKNHSCWLSSTKPRKKFGRVLKTRSDGMNNVFDEGFDEATDFILDSFEEFDDDEDDDEEEEEEEKIKRENGV
ncbi:probable Histone deacetylase HDA1 [Saccharomycodes ludwigii]|uniref:Histone deacetylase n=1 Tax=Saccharomycodes ludwigii TaxID=36035 RepID=A0A376B2Z7_9ASCO|nr:hypothetical protein SCDLUD_002755 [Saccharomycodes ludwigii]KAH3901266.1 hypothetical protein SCDLUD_002755 [Saccharomycodes ludwigii]SSD59021.1 probable Histone deacetylase HDA1 [Saccharomycodes ludwigii]